VPTYQYTCTECAERIEVVQKFTDEPLLVCSTCGGRLRKVFSPVGIVFKGSGFYRTDSRASASATATKEKTAKDKALNGSEPGSSSSGSDSSSSSDSAKDGGSSPGDKKAGKPAAAASSSDSSSSSG
jgi:putative FmdB family regulatory protein